MANVPAAHAQAALADARRDHFELLNRIKEKMDIDGASRSEYRWYEIWDPALNWIAQNCSARQEVGVAPQHTLARESFKDPVDVNDPDGSTKAAGESQASQISGSVTHPDAIEVDPSFDPEAAPDAGLSEELRIPDFILIRSTVPLRSILLIVEIKPLNDSNRTNGTTIIRDYHWQVLTQVAFGFEDAEFRHHRTIFAMLGIGDTFQFREFRRQDVSLPPHRLGADGAATRIANPMPLAAPPWSPILPVFDTDDDGVILQYSTDFRDAIETMMAHPTHGLQVTW
ncbi:hypothetical protein M422DRAFT_49206 [Sphaerobolus stellatus SS14]|uniref:Uncharacterized protein n=1 Tax=Sphaerobolus stellatus (strain SS14) TaxID=990650 RepID=A0A0C9VFP5_SPHS4|nr:hypothetical protein M422DRAFT_49206 [Sphaerobolus stellatus SS14]